MLTMLHAIGPAAGRVAAVVPVTLLVLFLGVLWLLGLVSGKDGRQYVTKISDQAMRAVSIMLHGASREDPAAPGQPPGTKTPRSTARRIPAP
jgi:hypothetical protein